MAQSEVSVCNLALQKLGAARIVSLDLAEVVAVAVELHRPACAVVDQPVGTITEARD